jgi:hypothetical protein
MRVVTHNETWRKWNKAFIGGTNSWLFQQILKSMFPKDVLNILNLQFLSCKTTTCHKSSTCHSLVLAYLVSYRYVRFWHCLPIIIFLSFSFPLHSLSLVMFTFINVLFHSWILQVHQHSTINHKATEHYTKFHCRIMLVNVKTRYINAMDNEAFWNVKMASKHQMWWKKHSLEWPWRSHMNSINVFIGNHCCW